MNCCNANGQCTQTGDCCARPSAYSSNFDRLGKPIEQAPVPYRFVDLLMSFGAVVLIVFTIAIA